MHIAPSEGQARPVGKAVMEMLFPEDDGRIPIVAVTGTNGKTTTSKIIAYILQELGYHVGLTCTDGVYIQNKKLFSGDCSGPYSAETVLMHPDVSACVFETARGGILRRGLGFDKANVAVFTNIWKGDHLGQDHIHTKEELCNVKATILKSIVDGVAIFNADDEELMRLASGFQGQKILFSMKENNPYIQKHIAAQQKVVFYDKNHKQMTLKSKSVLHQIPISQIKITHNATIDFQVMNLMTAIAGIWGMGINLDSLLSILESMHSSNQLALGRFNVFSINDRNLIVDYGHNLDATIALIDTLKHFPEKRRVLMISRPGDRNDEDIMSQMAELSYHFDEVIIYQENHLRSRQDGEILEVLQKGFSLDSRVKELHTIKDEQEALNFTLGRLNQDDLALLILDSLESGIEQIHQYYAREQ